jgi:hypothetical protein
VPVGEEWKKPGESRPVSAKARAGRLAARQSGRVSRRQLSLLGCDHKQVARWIADGFLIPELPRVYAVGNAARSIEANLTTAVL